MGKKTVIITTLICSITLAQNSKGLSPIVKSFLVPGWGEYSLEETKRGRIFVISEIALWTSFAGALTISNNYMNLFQAYAANHAGVVTNGKNRQFWVDIGNYESLTAHNEEHLRFREYDALYPTEGNWNWEWTSDTKRRQFREYRVLSDSWELGAKFIIGGIVINHIISAIDVQYLKRIAQVESVSVKPSIDPLSGHAELVLFIEL